MTTSPTPHLLAVLPEALWGEAIRRLRRTPALWALAADPAVAAVFASLKPDPHLWQPGRLALAVYAARHPETEGAAEAWLLGPGRDRLAAAYMRLLSAEPALDPVDDALPAALALRLRGQATTDWHAIAAEAVTQPDRWRLPLQYVAGLDATPEALLRGLLESTPAGAALAADCLTANFSTEAGFALLAGAGGAAPAAHWLALGRRLKALGAAPLARRLLAHASEDAPRPGDPAGDPQLTAALADHALLVAGGDDFTAAHPALVEAWTAVRGLRAELAGQIALLAAAAGAPSVALAAYQDALSDQPTEAAYALGLARAYLDLNEPAQALAALASVTEDPRAPALVARAQFAAGDLPAARAALEALDTTALAQPAELTEAADILQLTGQPAAAGRCRQAAAESAGLDPALHLAAARALADQNAWPEAVAAAQEAAALAPADPEARELLGQTLLAAGQAAAALPHFQSALTYQPERVTAGLGLAQAALTAGQPERALEAAQRALTLTPAAAPQGEAHVLMGQALAQLQRHPEAFEHFCQASALVPHAPGPWRAMAHYHRSQGEAAQAIQALEAGRQALKLADSPALAPVLLDLADAYLAMERPDEALSVLREAGAADPTEPEAHRQLGQLLVQLRQPDEAAAALRRALDLRPGDWRALHLLGQALEASQRTAEAWAAYQQATLARPAAPAPYFDLGRLTLALHARGVADATPRQAVAALGEAARLAPEDADAHGLLAQAQQLAQDPQAAFRSYQAAIRLEPNRPEWSLGFGQVCLEINRPEVAIAALQDALHHAPAGGTLALQTALTEAYGQSRLWAEAAQSAEAALRLDPENPALFAKLAGARAQLGEHAGAARAWEQATRLAPRDTTLQIAYARSLLAVDQTAEARRVFAQALAQAPDSAEVHLAAGQAWLALGESELAFTTLQEAVALAPRSAAAQAALGEAAMHTRRHDAAHAAFLRAAELEPATPRYWREAGEALWEMDRQAAAVTLWQRAAALNPDDTATLTRLGTALLRLGQGAEALVTLEKAAGQRPDDAAAAREAARAALSVGELDKAAEYLERAVEIMPGDAEVRYLLGQVYERQTQAEKALLLYRQAHRLNAGEGRYLAASADVQARTDLAAAVAGMETAVQLSPESAEVQQRAGRVFVQAGRVEQAVSAGERWAAARPREAAPHLALAQALTLRAEQRALLTRASAQLAADPDLPERIQRTLQQAAAFGADPQAVRFWLGRAKLAAGQAQEARLMLEAVLTGPGAAQFQTPEGYRALGAALRQTGQPERAREALQAALENGGETSDSFLELGLVHAALNDRRGAVVAFKRAVAAAPKSALAHYHLAEALAALGDQDEARQALQRALTLQPEAAWHHRLARWLEAGRHPGALAHYQHAAQLQPQDADLNADLARALSRDGDLAAAAPYYRRAVALRPDDGQLWAEAGQAQLAVGDHAGAAGAFAKAVALVPEHVPALLGGARVELARGDLQAAANYAETASRLAPDAAETLTCLADVEAARGDVTAAERHYTAAALQASAPAPIWLALGRLQLAQGKLTPAADALQRAALANPDSDEILATLGDARLAAGDHGPAVQAYREAVRIAPRNAKHLLRLGRACRSQGQLDQAIAHLMQGREAAPHNDELMREVGLVFEQRRQFDRALELYQLAIKSAPRVAANYTRAGVALKQLKDYTGSLSALERAVALDPKNLEAAKQLAAVTAMSIMHSDTPRLAGAAAGK